MNYGGDCRTALATPGLLITSLCSWEFPYAETVNYFCYGLRHRLKAKALAPPWEGVSNRISEHKRTNIFAMIFNCSRAVLKYIWHLDSYDISDNRDSSESSNSSDSREEQTCLQDFATVCISKRHYLVFGGPSVCAVSALVYLAFMSLNTATVYYTLHYTLHTTYWK